MTDVALQSLIGEFFAAVSFPEGGAPQYDRIRDVFIPEGLLIKNSGEPRRSAASTRSSRRARNWSTPDG